MTAQLVEKFYSSFSDRDGDAMAACYADDVLDSSRINVTSVAEDKADSIVEGIAKVVTN